MEAVSMEQFIAESNRIEGIPFVTGPDKAAHLRLWDLEVLGLPDINEFVAGTARAAIRDQPGMDVVVGPHVPPPGGPEIPHRLELLLGDLGDVSPYKWHLAYETLHPYMDGNGRSGRAIWAWDMMRRGRDPFQLGFLHTFYYQALEASRA